MFLAMAATSFGWLAVAVVVASAVASAGASAPDCTISVPARGSLEGARSQRRAAAFRARCNGTARIVLQYWLVLCYH